LHARAGDPAARALLEIAASVDPDGPLGKAAAADLEASRA